MTPFTKFQFFQFLKRTACSITKQPVGTNNWILESSTVNVRTILSVTPPLSAALGDDNFVKDNGGAVVWWCDTGDGDGAIPGGDNDSVFSFSNISSYMP